MNVVPKTTAFMCPCCKGFIGEAAPLDQVKLAITAPTRRQIFDLLSAEVGKPVMRADVLSSLDRKPSPQNIAVQISKLRDELEAFGWTITNSQGASKLAQWRLIPTEASA